MKTEELVIDMNNLYVQGLIKVINDFMLEEASGCIFTEDRLKSNIEKLKDVFPEERKRMVIAGRTPMFSSPTSGLYKLIFKANHTRLSKGSLSTTLKAAFYLLTLKQKRIWTKFGKTLKGTKDYTKYQI